MSTVLQEQQLQTSFGGTPLSPGPAAAAAAVDSGVRSFDGSGQPVADATSSSQPPPPSATAAAAAATEAVRRRRPRLQSALSATGSGASWSREAARERRDTTASRIQAGERGRQARAALWSHTVAAIHLQRGLRRWRLRASCRLLGQPGEGGELKEVLWLLPGLGAVGRASAVVAPLLAAHSPAFGPMAGGRQWRLHLRLNRSGAGSAGGFVECIGRPPQPGAGHDFDEFDFVLQVGQPDRLSPVSQWPHSSDDAYGRADTRSSWCGRLGRRWAAMRASYRSWPSTRAGARFSGETNLPLGRIPSKLS